ncbi:hypothetical protein SBY92_003138 [Candida maltosa Xu316]
MDQFYITSYIRFCWIISNNHINHNQHSFKSFQSFNAKYGKFIHQLILNSQLSSTNLIISLYYLFKHYHKNSILKYDNHQESTTTTDSMVIYNIIMSLILSNKSFDDQSYTLKTWLIIINNTLNNRKLIKLDLKLLNILESFFLSSLDFKLSFIDINQNSQFWSTLSNSKIFKINNSILNKFKSLISNTHESSPSLSSKTTRLSPSTSITSLSSTTSRSPQTPLSSSIPSINFISSPNSPLNTITKSNSTLPNFVSPLSSNYPLTPLTPCVIKKRRLATNTQYPYYPPQQYVMLPSQDFLLPPPPPPPQHAPLVLQPPSVNGFTGQMMMPYYPPIQLPSQQLQPQPQPQPQPQQQQQYNNQYQSQQYYNFY